MGGHKFLLPSIHCNSLPPVVVFAFLLAPFLGGIGAKQPTPPRTELKHSCSRSISRNVRKVLEADVLRLTRKEGLNGSLPGCPWNPESDLYALHELNKKRRTGRGGSNGWTCGICNKTFKSDYYLDLHLERKHMDVAPVGESFCLADYCEIFEVCRESKGSSVRRRSSQDCDDELLTKERQRCELALTRCFPLDQELSRKWHAKFSKDYCQVLRCSIRAERRRDSEQPLLPVIVPLLVLLLSGFIVFSMTVCCVDYSEDIFQALVDSGVASLDFIRKCRNMRDTTRQAVGVPSKKPV